jgi:hypothetical protein
MGWEHRSYFGRTPRAGTWYYGENVFWSVTSCGTAPQTNHRQILHRSYPLGNFIANSIPKGKAYTIHKLWPYHGNNRIWHLTLRCTASIYIGIHTFRGIVVDFITAKELGYISQYAGYTLDDRVIEVRSLEGVKDLSYSLCVQTGYGAHPAFCTMGSTGPFTGAEKRPGRYTDHLPPSSAEVVNEKELYILPPSAIKHESDCFTFTSQLPVGGNTSGCRSNTYSHTTDASHVSRSLMGHYMGVHDLWALLRTSTCT